MAGGELGSLLSHELPRKAGARLIQSDGATSLSRLLVILSQFSTYDSIYAKRPYANGSIIYPGSIL